MSELLTLEEKENEIESLKVQLEEIWKSLRDSISFQVIYTCIKQYFNILYSMVDSRTTLIVCFGNDVDYYWDHRLDWNYHIDKNFLIPLVKEGLLQVIKEHTTHKMIEVPKRIISGISVYQFKIPDFRNE